MQKILLIIIVAIIPLKVNAEMIKPDPSISPKDVILIQESIIEDLDAKQKIFKELDKLSSKNTILAS